MKIEWNFNNEAFTKAKEGIINTNADEDCLGNLYIGHLCFDLKMMNYENETVLDGDLYVGGIDSGYGETAEGKPYDLVDGICALNKKDLEEINTLGQFKKHVLEKALEHINGNEMLIQKANETELFNWN